MKYIETYPDAIFSRHIESYWQVKTAVDHSNTALELLLPTCTFNIIFTHKPYFMKCRSQSIWTLIKPGVSFIGQTSEYLCIKSDFPIDIIGVRFKPFAFANILTVPAIELSGCVVELNKINRHSLDSLFDINQLFEETFTDSKYQYLDEMMYTFLSPTMTIDEKLRAQINYIMERQGNLKINELTNEFKVSKVTLRKHFINKIGLAPKKICQIWRMNRVLQLKENIPNLNLTSVCLEAGFYDQSHFIKDFKSILGLSPKRFFAENTNLIQLSHPNIEKRFSNQYDPRVN